MRMGNILTFFCPRHGGMTPDQALEMLYHALTTQPGPLSYREWCRRLGLPRYKLDRYLRQALGITGEELVNTLSPDSGIKKEDALADIPLGFF